VEVGAVAEHPGVGVALEEAAMGLHQEAVAIEVDSGVEAEVTPHIEQAEEEQTWQRIDGLPAGVGEETPRLHRCDRLGLGVQDKCTEGKQISA
jgi:hypothetical protein